MVFQSEFHQPNSINLILDLIHSASSVTWVNYTYPNCPIITSSLVDPREGSRPKRIVKLEKTAAEYALGAI